MYDPNQPRVPAGDRYGGRWTGTGLGGGPAGGRHHSSPHRGPQVAGAGAAMPGVRGLGPFSPAMLPYLHGLLSQLASDALGRITFLGGLLVAALDQLGAVEGDLPQHPDIRYRYKSGILTLWQDVPGDNKPLLFHGHADEDGLYRLPDGTIIGRDLVGGVFLNEIAIVLEGKKRQAISSAQVGEAANDDIKLCPDPVPDHPSTETMSLKAQLYQQQIAKLKIGEAILLNGVKFDGCRTIDGVMLEAKGEEYAWALKNGEFFENYEGKHKILNQMQRQSKASRARLVEWHFAEKPVADYFEKAVEKLKLQGELLNIIVKHTAPIFYRTDHEF